MRSGLRYSLPAVLFLSFSLAAFGQITTGAITGNITHEGVVLQGVTITLASPAMQGERVAYSYVNGDYNFPSVPPGDYTVSFAMEGMTSQVVKVTVGLARIERVDAALVPAPLVESVSVVAAPPTVLETTQVQTNYTADEIDALPIGRSVQAVAFLAPGVFATNTSLFTDSVAALVVSGAPYYDSLYLINGAVTNESATGQTENLFIEDAIQESSVIVGAISAEYGRFTGGVISTITKSGGNEFSAGFRDSFTNPSWTSESALGEGTSDSRLGETYEGTLGGRVVRDRLWFFTAGRKADTSTRGFYVGSTIPMPLSEVTDERLEVKLTGQPTPRHSLTASYLDYDVSNTNVCSLGLCYEPSAVDASQSTSRMAASLRYSGTITDNVFAEGLWSSRKSSEHGVGGDHRTTDFSDPRDVALGTVGFGFTSDFAIAGIWGASMGCGACPGRTDDNNYLLLKGNWYVATEGVGTHNLAFGYENFLESVDEDVRVSASEFDVSSSSPPEREQDGTLRPVMNSGDWIIWAPIEETSQGSRMMTDSLFVNDKWDLGSKWSLNLGIRYDRNDAEDRAGKPLSKDHNVSPRIGVIRDVLGDGRLRVNASYSKYVSKMWEPIGFIAGGGGQTAWLAYYEYRGPAVGGEGSGLDSFDVLEEVFRWFFANGGTANSDLLLFTLIPGEVFELASPNVVEWSFGSGMQLGSRGFLRIDAQDRKWHDAYSASTTVGNVIENPVSPGTYLDMVTYANSEAFKRTYQGITLQSGYRLTLRVSAGGNYTWSKTRGNYDGGEWPDVISPLVYPEYKTPQSNPVGYLRSDQTHKGRLWINYAQSLGSYGTTNLSVLQSYQSGTPYSASANIFTSPYVDNPGYATPPPGASYYFSDRGEYRWQAASATDLAINYELPVRKARVFLQADILNIFNQQAQIGGETNVVLLESFDPFTETPKECPQGQADCTGYNWQKGKSFGKATMPGHYQLPRTYRFSAGFRF